MTDKESLPSIETEVQIEERTRHAMQNYFDWLRTHFVAIGTEAHTNGRAEPSTYLNGVMAAPWRRIQLLNIFR